MAGHGEKLGRKQEDATAALLLQRNIEDAARAANIGARMLIRWLKLPEFQAAYRKARSEAVSQAIARMQQATGAAGVTVLKLMTDVNVPAAVRLRAAECEAAVGVDVQGRKHVLALHERRDGKCRSRSSVLIRRAGWVGVLVEPGHTC
jgi:hypothetical protein